MSIIYKIAFFLLLVFYSSYFTKQLLLRRKGIRTNRLGKGEKTSSVTTHEKALLKLTMAMGVWQFCSILFVKYLNNITFSLFSFSTSLQFLSSLCGLLLMLFGVLFFIASIAVMGKNWRAGIDDSQDTKLVTTGVYLISRNPAFVGFILLYIGSFFVTPNYLLLILFVLCSRFFHSQILYEEQYLLQKFGITYKDYFKNTPRYLLFK